MRQPYFWLLNGLLVLLFLWTLGEETAVSIQVKDGHCTAVVPERHITVDCPQIGAASRVGLYTIQPSATMDQLTALAPLSWLAPHAAWTDLTLSSGEGEVIWQQSSKAAAFEQTLSGGWEARWGELRGTERHNALWLAESPTADFVFNGSLRRANNGAGLLLLEANGQNGLLFLVDGRARRGVWWLWQDGQPTEPLFGIPFQKPFLQQAQSLLRLLLTGHQGALLLLAVAWLLKQAKTRLTTAKSQFTFQPAPISNLTVNEKTAAAGLTFLAFALTGWIASDVLARVPHVQDSLTYLFQAETLAAGKLWAPAPPLPDFFAQEFLLVRDGRWFGKYIPGFPAILALGVRLQAPWLINPFLATLTVPLIYQLGRRLYNSRIGLLAAGLMTVSPFFLFLSGSHMAHAAELFWLTLFMVAWLEAVRFRKSGHSESGRIFTDSPGRKNVDRLNLGKWALVAGLAAGMAFLTRQLTAVAVTAPFLLLTIWRSPLPGQLRRQVGLIWLAGLLPLVALLFVYQGAVTGDPWQDPRLLYWSYDQLGFGEEVGESPNLLEIVLLDEAPGYAVLWRTDPDEPPRGHTPQRGLHNILRNWEALQSSLFGWLPLLTFSFLWLAFLLKRPSGVDSILLLTLTMLVAAEAFYWHSGIMYGPRYFYGGLPPLLLLTARGAQVLAGWLGGRLGWWLTAVFLALLLLGNIFFNLPRQAAGFRGFNFIVGDKVAQVETTVSPDELALVFVHSPVGNWWEYGEYFLGNTPWLDGQIIYARDLGGQANLALAAVYPERNAYLLEDGALLTIGRDD